VLKNILRYLSCSKDFAISKLHTGAVRSARNLSALMAAALAMFLILFTGL